MTKWILLKEVGEPKEFEIFDVDGNPLSESNINRVKDDQIYMADSVPFNFDDDKIVRKNLLIIDTTDNTKYLVDAGNFFYDNYEDCLTHHIKSIEILHERFSNITEIENEIENKIKNTLNHFKVLNRRIALNNLLDEI